MRDKSSSSFRHIVLAGAVCAALAGATDGAEVALGHRLGLGPIGVIALLLAGAFAAAPLGAAVALLLAPWASRRADGWLVGALGGASVVLAARVAVAVEGSVEAAVGVAAGVTAGLVLTAVGLRLSSRSPERARVVGLALLGGMVLWVMWVRTPAPKWRPVEDERPNVLLVTVGAARYDHLGGPALETPAMRALAADGTAFDLAWAGALDPRQGATSLLYGRAPWEGLAEAGESLAAALTAEGYHAGAVIGTSALARDGVLDRGFSVYDDDQGWPKGVDRTLAGRWWALLTDGRPRHERRADEVVERAARFIAGQSGRWFCWVHLDDPSAPYEPPVPYDERFYAGGDPREAGTRGMHGPIDPAHGARFAGVTDVAYVEAQYDGEVAWTDEQLGRLIAALGEAGWTARTLVAVVGLQGEALQEGERWFGHSGPLGEGALHVPAVLRLPGRVPVAQRVRSPVELSDFAATLLDYAGEGEAIEGATGISLRATVEGRGVARGAARAVGSWAEVPQVAVRERGVLLVHTVGGKLEVRRFAGEEEHEEPWTPERLLGLWGRAVALDGTGAAPPDRLDAAGEAALEALRGRR